MIKLSVESGTPEFQLLTSFQEVETVPSHVIVALLSSAPAPAKNSNTSIAGILYSFFMIFDFYDDYDLL